MELLVVVAVIAIIAAIAVPGVVVITDQSRSARAQRNAQSIVSTFSAMRGAGYNVTLTRAQAVAVVVDDEPVTGDPAGNGMRGEFIIGGLNIPAAEVTEASVYVASSGTGGNLQLVYSPSGGQTAL